MRITAERRPLASSNFRARKDVADRAHRDRDDPRLGTNVPSVHGGAHENDFVHAVAVDVVDTLEIAFGEIVRIRLLRCPYDARAVEDNELSRAAGFEAVRSTLADVDEDHGLALVRRGERSGCSRGDVRNDETKGAFALEGAVGGALRAFRSIDEALWKETRQ